MINLSKRLADMTIGELRELTHALSAMPCGSDTDTLGLVIGFVEPEPPKPAPIEEAAKDFHAEFAKIGAKLQAPAFPTK